MSHIIIAAHAEGDILACDEGLSFWGGVNADTGDLQDALHPQFGQCLAGKVVMMPTSRGSCSGSGVLLNLLLNGAGPAALVFREAEDILTLGAVVAARMFDVRIPVLRLGEQDYEALAAKPRATLTADGVEADQLRLSLEPLSDTAMTWSDSDLRMQAGEHGPAVQMAMEVVIDMARALNAPELIDVTRAHIDGCIYAGPAFLTFAERMADLGGKVRIPTTMNAISVDHTNWRSQGVDPAFGGPASRLADAYVRMGAEPSFTCAPYLLPDKPQQGEDIAWSESNAVIYANSVLGARTVKHPDFLDLCMALTGRAPKSGVYFDEGRTPRRIVDVVMPEGADDAFWPLLGWLLGMASPDRIPLLKGLEGANPDEDDLKALCAAFGTTSAAPMLHIAGITPEAGEVATAADQVQIAPIDFAEAWRRFNSSTAKIDLIAIGSPHASANECRKFLKELNNRKRHKDVSVIITLSHATLNDIVADGTEAALRGLGVTIVPDLCWCSISEPVFPPSAQVVMTNSGKYAHYGPALSGREVKIGGMAECAAAAIAGYVPETPRWVLDIAE